MQNTISLQELESVTHLDVRTMAAKIYAHTKVFGFNFAVTSGNEVLMLEEYYQSLVSEYEVLNSYVLSNDILLDSRSNTIPFASGSYLYFLYDDSALVYIGQTVNMADRIYDHTRNKKFNSVSYHAVPGDIRVAVESLNINFHNPKYNINNDVEYVFSQTLRKLFG